MMKIELTQNQISRNKLLLFLASLFLAVCLIQFLNI